MDLREAWSALRAGWWIVVLGLVLGGAAGFGATRLQTPLYSTSTQLFVSTTPSATATDPTQADQLARDRVASYAQLLTGPDVARRVVDQLGLHMTPAQLTDELTVSVPPGTVLLDVTVTDPSAQQAVRIADAASGQLAAAVTRLETASGGATPVQIVVASPPQSPRAPSSPDVLRTTGVAALLGLFVGVVVALVRPVVRRSVRSGEEAAELVGAPVLGSVPRARVLRSHRLAVTDGAEPADSFRRIRTNLQFLELGAYPLVLLIASAVDGEGKTTLLLNLARSLTRGGRSVTVVEGDLRSPAVARALQLPGRAGLTDVLAGTAAVDDAVQTYPVGGFSVVAAGAGGAAATELLGAGDMRAVVEKLRNRSDVVLIEGPPLLSVVDSAELAGLTDGVLLCVRPGRTRRPELERAAAMLDFAGARTLGVVLTKTSSRSA